MGGGGNRKWGFNAKERHTTSQRRARRRRVNAERGSGPCNGHGELCKPGTHRCSLHPPLCPRSKGRRITLTCRSFFFFSFFSLLSSRVRLEAFPSAGSPSRSSAGPSRSLAVPLGEGSLPPVRALSSRTAWRSPDRLAPEDPPRVSPPGGGGSSLADTRSSRSVRRAGMRAPSRGCLSGAGAPASSPASSDRVDLLGLSRELGSAPDAEGSSGVLGLVLRPEARG